MTGTKPGQVHPGGGRAFIGDRYDYVTTVVAGAPWNAYLTYVYTEGALEGTATLPAPNERGAYEGRAFFKEDGSILRGSVAFEVHKARRCALL